MGGGGTPPKPTTGCYRLGLGFVDPKSRDTDVALLNYGSIPIINNGTGGLFLPCLKTL